MRTRAVVRVETVGHLPSSDRLPQLAGALDIDLHDLFRDRQQLRGDAAGDPPVLPVAGTIARQQRSDHELQGAAGNRSTDRRARTPAPMTTIAAAAPQVGTARSGERGDRWLWGGRQVATTQDGGWR